MVVIYLNLPESQVSFLSVPNSDVERLSIRSFRWLRYVMFSICGARGELSATPSGHPVNYGSTELDDIPYYYTPSEKCIFVDHKGLNDLITTTNQTRRRFYFRKDVVQRYGSRCVITQENGDECDAVHLISRSKGDEYIKRVVRDRSPLYPSSSTISGIDDVRNGILLRKDLHSALARGKVAFLTTPNYGLDPDDIKRLGPARADHVTLQRLKKPNGDDPNLLEIFKHDLHSGAAFAFGANLDAVFEDPRSPPPPAIILDYLYGVAAYNQWRSGQGDEMMENYRREHYEDIPLPLITDDGPQEGITPLWESGSKWRPYTSIRRGDVMVAAMDELNSVLMSFNGITPQQAANRREKQLQEEELKAQEVSQRKVMGWIG